MRLLFFVLLLSLCATCFAQSAGREWSIGPRLGGATGLSIKKHSFSNKQAFEFIFANSFDENLKGFTITALYQKLAHLNSTGRVSAIIGGGATVNFRDQTKAGITGIVGFDWRLKRVPINLQLDWAPTLVFINKGYFSGVNAAVTGRYVLNHKRK